MHTTQLSILHIGLWLLRLSINNPTRLRHCTAASVWQLLLGLDVNDGSALQVVTWLH